MPMRRRDLLRTAGAAAATAVTAGRAAAEPAPAVRPLKIDIHTHHYPEAFFQKIRDTPGTDFSFGQDPAGRTIIKYRGARFFGIQPAMTDVAKRLADMDRVGIDVAVISLSTPNVFFADEKVQPEVARMVNDAYAKLQAEQPRRFLTFASIPMDAPDAALQELHRAILTLKMNGVILLSNIRGRPLTAPVYRPFFEEANRLKLAILLHPMIPANADQFQEYVLGPIVGFPFDTTLAVARMCYDGMLKDFPDIRWIICHAGGAIPWLLERLDNGYRDFAENKVKLEPAAQPVPEAALLRHRHLQPPHPQPAPRPGRGRAHAHGERLPAPPGLHRPGGHLHRGAPHPRRREAADPRGHR